MIEVDRNLGRRWFEEVWIQGPPGADCGDDGARCIIHDGGHSMRGPEGLPSFFRRIHAAFSDNHVVGRDTISEGDLL